MKKLICKVTTILLIVAAAAMVSGCYGSFALTKSVHSWNRTFKNNWGREIVFLGCCIIPVYEFTTFVDAIILNTIEFWGGRNPLAMNEGEEEESEISHDGRMYKVIKSKNNMTIAAVNGEDSANFRYFPDEKAWYLMEGESKVKVVEVKDGKVFTYLPSQETLVLNQNTAAVVAVK